MWNTFPANVKRQNPGNGTFTGRGNPNSFNVQQNDPTAIANLPEAQRKNAIVPFPRGRYRTPNKGYYTITPDGLKTNNYNTEDGHRTAADASAIKLLDADSTVDDNTSRRPTAATSPQTRSSGVGPDLHHAVAAGSTPNWVQAPVLQPRRPCALRARPPVRAPEATGVTPDPRVRDRQRRDRRRLIARNQEPT